MLLCEHEHSVPPSEPLHFSEPYTTASIIQTQSQFMKPKPHLLETQTNKFGYLITLSDSNLSLLLLRL
jgi:hypothetical protein